MKSKHILIVDDEPKVAFFLAKALGRTNASYKVQTAHSGAEALDVLDQTVIDLLITDLRMPNMDGLELMKRVRNRHPDCRMILMTAYGSPEIEAMSYQLEATRYITKPFSLDDLNAAVSLALAEPEAPGRNILVISDERFEKIAKCLADLRFEVGAQCILLADVSGPVIAQVGELQGMDTSTLISLAGGSFATAFEMARYLEERKSVTLNYHEGEKYDVYSSNVNTDLFLMLIFYKHGQRSRVGMVWLYIQRTLEQLQSLVADAEQMDASEALGDDFGAMLSDSLDALFTVDEQIELMDALPVPEATSAEAEVAVAAPRPARAQDDAVNRVMETFSFEQAMNMGLIETSWKDNTEE
ncbi:MAG: response regulator [Anaerolineae bacterium]|nr:response regulator [Anaerolineae bacterium]